MLAPPMPPVTQAPISPSYASMAGGATPPQVSMDGGATAGTGQMGTVLTQLGTQIDQALKQLAKISPDMAPWVLKTSLELVQQIGQSLQKGQLANLGGDNSAFPDGSSRISGLS